MNLEPAVRDIQKWVKVLRSREYAQTTGWLQDERGYCPLGVACKVFIPKQNQDFDSSEMLTGGMPIDQPHAPMWLKSIDGDFHAKVGVSLSALNDTSELSFDEIADLLEAVYVYRVLD
jgi:hypothetical protein